MASKENKYEDDVLELVNKVDDMVTNDDFEKAFTNVTLDITDLKNDQSKTNKTVYENVNQINELNIRSNKFEIDIQGFEQEITQLANNNLVDDISNITQYFQCIQFPDQKEIYSTIIDDAVYDKNRESNLLFGFKLCYQRIQSFLRDTFKAS